MRPLGLLLAAALAAPLPASGDEAGWELSAELSAGADGNATRTASPEPAVAASFVGLTARGRGQVSAGPWRGQAWTTLAARLYPGAPDADAAAASADAEGSRNLAEGLWAGLSLGGSNLADTAGRLARHTLRGAASLSLGGARLGASLSGGWALLAPRDRVLRTLSAEGPQAALRAWWSPSAGHTLTLTGSAWRQDHPRWPAPARREDTTWTGGAEYAWRGAALAALGLEASRNDSSVLGGDYERQRLTARLAAWLPLELALAARVGLQRSQYRAPLLLPDQFLLADGGEGQVLVEARLSRSLGGRWEVALQAAHYRSEAARGGGAPAFERSVASLALGWRARSDDDDDDASAAGSTGR